MILLRSRLTIALPIIVMISGNQRHYHSTIKDISKPPQVLTSSYRVILVMSSLSLERRPENEIRVLGNGKAGSNLF